VPCALLGLFSCKGQFVYDRTPVCSSAEPGRAGVQAAFGAPIGGVLFSMEEACSFWTRKVAWRCFVAAILAAFTLTVFSEYGDRGVIVFTNVHALNNFDMIRQSPLIVAVAMLGGLIGAFFNTLRRALWPLRASRSRKFLRVAEALLVIIVTVTVQFICVAKIGRCVEIPEGWPSEFEVCFSFQCG
jgi:chloride channel 7